MGKAEEPFEETPELGKWCRDFSVGGDELKTEGIIPRGSVVYQKTTRQHVSTNENVKTLLSIKL